MGVSERAWMRRDTGNYYCAAAPEETVTAMLFQQPYGAVRTANVQQFRPWRGPRPGGDGGNDA